MATRTVSVTDSGGSTRTVIIPDRSRFAGIRTVTVNGQTVTINRSASVNASDTRGASRPLLSKVVGGAAAAYSLRDLNDASGNNRVVRAHRTSDSASRDFTSKEITDGTLTSWATNSNAFVTTWYDQSGLGRDALTSNSLFPLQGAPQIVDTGTLITANSKPSLLFNVSKLSISEDITGQDFSVYAVVKPNQEDPSTDGYIFDNFTSFGRGLFHDDFYSGRFTIITDTTSTTPTRQRVQVALEQPANNVPELQLISGAIDNTLSLIHI